MIKNNICFASMAGAQVIKSAASVTVRFTKMQMIVTDV